MMEKSRRRRGRTTWLFRGDGRNRTSRETTSARPTVRGQRVSFVEPVAVGERLDLGRLVREDLRDLRGARRSQETTLSPETSRGGVAAADRPWSRRRRGGRSDRPWSQRLPRGSSVVAAAAPARIVRGRGGSHADRPRSRRRRGCHADRPCSAPTSIGETKDRRRRLFAASTMPALTSSRLNSGPTLSARPRDAPNLDARVGPRARRDDRARAVAGARVDDVADDADARRVVVRVGVLDDVHERAVPASPERVAATASRSFRASTLQRSANPSLRRQNIHVAAAAVPRPPPLTTWSTSPALCLFRAKPSPAEPSRTAPRAALP